MNKENLKRTVVGLLLFLAGVAIVFYGYYANIQYNKERGIDAMSGATQIYE